MESLGSGPATGGLLASPLVAGLPFIIMQGRNIVDVNNFAEACHDNAVKHGFWDREPPIGVQLMNMTSEVAEAWEFYRNGQDLLDPDKQILWTPSKIGSKPDGFFVELADVVIRVFDTMMAYDVRPTMVLAAKHDYNLRRPYLHGGKKA